MTQIYIKQNIHKHRTQNFRRISPFGIAPVEKKAHMARTHWYRRPFRRFINTRFFKMYEEKGMDRSNKKIKVNKIVQENGPAGRKRERKSNRIR